MSVNSESKFFKLASSVKKMVNTKKKNEEYFTNSDFDTTSTGSNESELSVQLTTTKPLTPDSRSTKSAKESKVKLSKSLRKKFFRHFPNVEEDEEILNRYHCALLGDILLQGFLYITNNYYAFYSNVFGYVTKILIPILTVKNITKEKTARIVPNAIGIATSEQKHVFGSFLSRDNTMEYMINVWQKAIRENPEIDESELAEEEVNSSEYGDSDKDSPPDDSIQPEGLRKGSMISIKAPLPLKKISKNRVMLSLTTVLLILLYTSAAIMLYRINQIQNKYNIALEDVTAPESNVAYSDLLQWQSKLHLKSGNAVYSYLDENLDQIAKVKQSLEALSSLLVDTSKPITEEVNRDPHETGKNFS